MTGLIEALGDRWYAWRHDSDGEPRWFANHGRGDRSDKRWYGYLVFRRPADVDIEAQVELARLMNFGWGLSYRRSEWDATVNVNAGRVGSGWFSMKGVLPHLKDRVGDYEPRHVQANVSLHRDEIEPPGQVRWAFWTHQHSWTRGRYPAWREGHWNASDWLLGTWRHSSDETIAERPVRVPIYEDGATYPGSAKVELREWRRSPRFGLGRFVPTVQHRVSAWVDVEHGIPFPGKGENSWDCGMDAIFGTGASLDTMFDASPADVRPDGDAVNHVIGEALANVAAAARRNRERYGGPGWALPEGMVETDPDGTVTKVELR